MTGRTHDLAAVTALGIVVLSVPAIQDLNLATALVAVFASLVGGIAPDIDQPTAPLWRNLPIGGFVGRIVDRLLGGHRFLTHSLLGVGLLSGLVYLLANFLHPLLPAINSALVVAAFAIGALSHLAMDMLTKEGVPLLLPIPYRLGLPPVKALRITTGKFIESGLVFPGLIILDLSLGYTQYHQIIAMAHGLR